jgi:tRNA A37 threonylcarbamoyladenosine synthetase subunit TsaC/SUA5/YrdC
LRIKKQIENYCEVNELQKKIIDKFLPGPLTVILKRKEGVPNFIGNEEGTIAIIGPKRMEYERVVGMLEYMKENIER